MEVDSTTSLLKNLQDDDLVFAYSGSISDSITHKIIELTQSNIDSAGNFVKFKNKISFLMAECYQNVARHSKYSVDESDAHEQHGAFYVRSVGNTFHIASANVVSQDLINSIKEKLDKVNSLSPDELRLLQKEVLARGKLSDRGGAGLGIIEMARRTGQRISYSFDPINSNLATFFLQLNISSSSEVPIGEEECSLERMKKLYYHMLNSNLIVVHKGDFSESSILPIIHMIEKNILHVNDVKGGKQKLYNVSVELLQNISMHAHREDNHNEALFTLKRKGDTFIIGVSNYIKKTDVATLSDTLTRLHSFSKQELDELYREKLRLLIDESTSGVGIGLIYIFRKTRRIDYSFAAADGDRALYTMAIEV